MGKSTFISAALHAAILLFALVAFSSAKVDQSPLAIPIDLAAPPSEVTKLKAGDKDAKDDAALAGKPKEEKPEAVKEANPKPEDTASLADAKPDKPEQEKPKPEAKAEAKKPETKKTAEAKPKPKPAPKKNEFNPDRIAALLNKIPDAADEPKPVVPDDAPPKKVKGQSNGTEMTMSVNEIDALRARIANCWTPPPGGLGADKIVIKLRLRLNEDGTLVGYPTIANSDPSPFFQAAADSAVRAVYQCQPYELPSEKYALWRDMILNFDPSDMYRSG
jgi:outer membrane biosynthesis protein TonB